MVGLVCTRMGLMRMRLESEAVLIALLLLGSRGVRMPGIQVD